MKMLQSGKFCAKFIVADLKWNQQKGKALVHQNKPEV